MQLRSRFWIRSVLAIALLIVAPIAILAVRNARSGAGTPPGGHLSHAASINSAIFNQLPLAFEANEGQAPEAVRFVARAPGGNVLLTDTGVVFALNRGIDQSQTTSFRMNLKGAAPRSPRGFQELSGRANYFIGNDPSRWHTGIAMYRQVKCTDVYPGIDLVYYGNQRQLEYDLVIRPGGDPGAIRWAIEGVDAVDLGPSGELIIRVAGNEMRHQPPRVYQRIGKERREVHGGYLLASGHEIGFQLGEYDRAHPVLIDPVLTFSTFAGGSAQDYGRGIVVDSSGAYVTGATFSTNFPTTAPRQSALGGNFDAFVLKLNPAGSALIYATYLGGTGADYGSAIAVDGSGNAYVTGWTTSTNFPTANPLQASGRGAQDAFVTKLSPTGSSLVYSTYLGGNNDDFGRAIAVDGSGAASVAGSTQSTNFPTANAYQGANRGGVDAFVSKINPNGSGFTYSTYLGGTLVDEVWGIALDSTGAAYLVGTTLSNDFPTASAFRSTRTGSSDVFVTKLSSSGSLAYSTYLGGTGPDFGYGIAVDASGSAVAVGQTLSTDFPVFPPPAASNPAFQQSLSGGSDAFVTKLSPAGSTLVYSTFLGGTSSEAAYGVALGASGNAFVTGDTLSTNFPTMGSLQAPGGDVDVFVTQLNAVGSALIYSTYLGGAGEDSGRAIAVDSAGNAYVTGQTQSTNLPTTSGALQAILGGGMDAFVAKVGPSTTVALSSIDPNTGPTTGGTTLLLRGANFTAGTTVTIGGVGATNVVVTSAGTINATTPAHVAGTVDIVVTNPDSQTSTLAGGFVYADPTGPANSAGGKGCGSTGAPVGIWLGAATLLRRYLRRRRRSGQND